MKIAGSSINLTIMINSLKQPRGKTKEVMMKFCKDCKYRKGASCSHEKAIMRVDMVTGKIEGSGCNGMRTLNEFCGEVAKLFEPSLWYRIKNGLTRCFRKSQKNN